MARREQKEKKPSRKEEALAETATTTDSKDREGKLADIDSVLDEIDELLEENAETFVREYRQKGGE